MLRCLRRKQASPLPVNVNGITHARPIRISPRERIHEIRQVRPPDRPRGVVDLQRAARSHGVGRARCGACPRASIAWTPIKSYLGRFGSALLHPQSLALIVVCFPDPHHTTRPRHAVFPPARTPCDVASSRRSGRCPPSRVRPLPPLLHRPARSSRHDHLHGTSRLPININNNNLRLRNRANDAAQFSPERAVWIEQLDFTQNITVPGLSPLFPDVACLEDGKVCIMTVSGISADEDLRGRC